MQHFEYAEGSPANTYKTNQQLNSAQQHLQFFVKRLIQSRQH